MDKFFYDKIFNIFFPNRCGFCGSFTCNGSYVCKTCQPLKYSLNLEHCILCGKKVYNKDNICKECSIKKIYYDKLIYCSEYKDVIKKELLAYKFNDSSYLYNFFAEILGVKLLPENADIICTVPISKLRMKERGYNQSKLIGKKVSNNLGKQYADLLVKTHETLRQSELDRSQRLVNIKNSFALNDKYDIKGKSVILIDDIFTTGATVNECSKILRKAGAKRIIVAVIAISTNK